MGVVRKTEGEGFDRRGFLGYSTVLLLGTASCGSLSTRVAKGAIGRLDDLPVYRIETGEQTTLLSYLGSEKLALLSLVNRGRECSQQLFDLYQLRSWYRKVEVVGLNLIKSDAVVERKRVHRWLERNRRVNPQGSYDFLQLMVGQREAQVYRSSANGPKVLPVNALVMKNGTGYDVHYVMGRVRFNGSANDAATEGLVAKIEKLSKFK